MRFAGSSRVGPDLLSKRGGMTDDKVPISTAVTRMLRAGRLDLALDYIEHVALTPDTHDELLKAITKLVSKAARAEEVAQRQARSEAVADHLARLPWTAEINRARQEVRALRKPGTWFPIHLMTRKYLQEGQLDLAIRYLQYVDFKAANTDDYLKAVGTFRRTFATLVKQRINEAEQARAERIRALPNRPRFTDDPAVLFAQLASAKITRDDLNAYIAKRRAEEQQKAPNGVRLPRVTHDEYLLYAADLLKSKGVG